MIFSLFAPTIDNVKLLLDDNEFDMDKQRDGIFVCNVSDLSDGDHQYKFRIKKKDGYGQHILILMLLNIILKKKQV